MEVLRFRIPDSSCEVFLERSATPGNRVTIILGENGTRKSTLLRAMLDDSIQDPEQKRRHRYPSAFTIFSREPSQVIALSAIPNDRFPTKKRYGEDRIDGRYSAENYEYIGPRHNQNIVSRNQSLQALAAAAIFNPTPEYGVCELIKKISRKTGIPVEFNVYVQPVFSRFNETHRPDPRKIKLLERLSSSEKTMINNALELAHSNKPNICLSLVGQSSEDSALIECIALAYRLGFVNFRAPKNLKKLEPEIFNVEHFSAGQWGLFATLATLALRVKNDALILIDEPESALHPRWQREYMDNLMDAVNHRDGCHIFLATHSPLIVGTAGAENVELVTLRKDDSGELIAQLSDVPVGWQSNDVLEDKFELISTRSPEFVAQVEEVLAIVAGGIKGNKTKLRLKLAKLQSTMAGLPENDSLHGLISSLNRLAE